MAACVVRRANRVLLLAVYSTLFSASAVTATAQSWMSQRLLNEADSALDARDYHTAVSKFAALVNTLDRTTPANWVEMIYFKIGLACLMDHKAAEAEEAFTTCITKFRNGPYTNRCYLGVGRACLAQPAPEKKDKAIKALKIAITDPKYAAEAGLELVRMYHDSHQEEAALTVYRSLMGSPIDSFEQANAAVEMLCQMSHGSNLAEVLPYLERLRNQAGVRNSLSWFVSRMIIAGDEAGASKDYGLALAFYQTVPSRRQILECQSRALDAQRKILRPLEATLATERNNPDKPRSKAGELLASLKPSITLAETAIAAIDGNADFDAALLMRRGRCLYHLERPTEALLCFRTLRAKYPAAIYAKDAAYAEISLLSQPGNTAELQARSAAYLRAYPDADNAEQIAALAGESLVKDGKWPQVGTFYKYLETQFPTSTNLDRYVFFQAIANFQNAEYAAAALLLESFLKNYPNSNLLPSATYYAAMARFFNNEYPPSLVLCNEYLAKFPNGDFAGELLYRRAIIYSSDNKTPHSDQIIGDIEGFLKDHPNDPVAGSMLCLLADTYFKSKDENAALEAFRKAVWSDSPDDVIQRALDSATTILQSRKDWSGIAALHGEFLKRKPSSPLAQVSSNWVVKMKTRGETGDGAIKILADELKTSITDPANAQVEEILDQLVKTLVPRKNTPAPDPDALDKQLVELLNGAINGKDNLTANARIYYARARLCQALKISDRAELYLKGIATNNAKDPSVLSPALLELCGNILLKRGNLDDASNMFKRLVEHCKDSLFRDAGPVGLGFVALARKQSAEALQTFEDVLESHPDSPRFKEATLGKLQALVELERDEAADKLALQVVGDKQFHGEPAGRAYLLQAQGWRKQADKGETDAALELRRKAYAIYQRVYLAYQNCPDLCAEAYWQAYETAKELHQDALATDTLQALAKHPKLQNTQRASDAVKQKP